MAKKTFFKIMLENMEDGTKQEIARVKSQGLAYSTFKFYQESIYNRSFDKLTIE